MDVLITTILDTINYVHTANPTVFIRTAWLSSAKLQKQQQNQPTKSAKPRKYFNQINASSSAPATVQALSFLSSSVGVCGRSCPLSVGQHSAGSVHCSAIYISLPCLQMFTFFFPRKGYSDTL